MPRINPREMNHIIKQKNLDLFWTSIAGLEGRMEVKNFFKDLLSETEAIMFARRLEVARMLLAGHSYQEISKKLQVGENTIGKVQRWLTSGFGGYEKALKGFERALEKRGEIEKNKYIQPYSFDWLRKKYPLQFLLFNLINGVGKGLKNKNLSKR